MRTLPKSLSDSTIQNAKARLAQRHRMVLVGALQALSPAQQAREIKKILECQDDRAEFIMAITTDHPKNSPQDKQAEIPSTKQGGRPPQFGKRK